MPGPWTILWGGGWSPEDWKELRVTGWAHRANQLLEESLLEFKKPLSGPFPTQRPPTASVGVPVLQGSSEQSSIQRVHAPQNQALGGSGED